MSNKAVDKILLRLNATIETVLNSKVQSMDVLELVMAAQSAVIVIEEMTKEIERLQVTA